MAKDEESKRKIIEKTNELIKSKAEHIHEEEKLVATIDQLKQDQQTSKAEIKSLKDFQVNQEKNNTELIKIKAEHNLEKGKLVAKLIN